jgi:hypothetical protein
MNPKIRELLNELGFDLTGELELDILAALRTFKSLRKIVLGTPPTLLSPATCRCDGCGSEAVPGDVFCASHRESYAAKLLGEGGGI